MKRHLVTTALVLTTAAAALAGPRIDVGQAWRPGAYWIVESPRTVQAWNEATGAVTSHPAGMWRTRFTVIWAEPKYLTGNPVHDILIEPSVPGEYGFGEHVEDYVLRIHADGLRVINEYRRGESALGQPLDRAPYFREVEDQVHAPRVWVSSMPEAGDFPESLVLAWPAVSPAESYGSAEVPDVTVNGVEQVVSVDARKNVLVRIRHPTQSKLRDAVLKFTPGRPWYDVIAPDGTPIVSVVETGTRDIGPHPGGEQDEPRAPEAAPRR